MTVVVPSWFGVADRQHVATYLDPDTAWQLLLVSSTLAGVYAHHVGKTDGSDTHAVLCIDLRRGWSAGLVRVEPTGLTEVACWGSSDRDPTGRIADEIASGRLVDHLLASASTVPGTPSISAVLVMDDDGVVANLVRQAIVNGEHVAQGCQVYVKRARQLIARGGEMIGGDDRIVSSVGSLPRALVVLAGERPDDRAEHNAVRVVAAEHAMFPSSTRLTFDLGPNDGSPLHFDVYEQHSAAVDHESARRQAVVRAHLVRERGYDRSMVVTFDLGADGLFTIGPVNAWRLEWLEDSVDLGEFE